MPYSILHRCQEDVRDRLKSLLQHANASRFKMTCHSQRSQTEFVYWRFFVKMFPPLNDGHVVKRLVFMTLRFLSSIPVILKSVSRDHFTAESWSNCPTCDSLTILKTLISTLRCVWSGLELNSAGKWSREPDLSIPVLYNKGLLTAHRQTCSCSHWTNRHWQTLTEQVQQGEKHWPNKRVCCRLAVRCL